MKNNKKLFLSVALLTTLAFSGALVSCDSDVPIIPKDIPTLYKADEVVEGETENTDPIPPSENVEEEVKRRKSLRIVINSIRELKKDMIYTKKAFTPRIEISPDKCCSELNLCDNMDYSNVVHVKNALLIYPSERISNEFNIIAYDIQKAINDLKLEGKLSAYELKLIDLYRKTVSNIKICSKELNKHRTQIYRDLDRIVEKICKKLNKK